MSENIIYFGDSPYRETDTGYEPVFEDVPEGVMPFRVSNHTPDCDQNRPAIITGVPCNCPKTDFHEPIDNWLSRIGKLIGKK